jgi:hypothetical protein
MRLIQALTIGVILAAGGALAPRSALADRVCDKECTGSACEEHCYRSENGGGDESDREAGRERHEERERYEHRRDDDRPGVGVYVPGVGGVEVGR